MIETRNFWQILTEPFKALQNKTFATLYLAQTISLLGDAFSWVGLALLAYQIDKDLAICRFFTLILFKILTEQRSHQLGQLIKSLFLIYQFLTK